MAWGTPRGRTMAYVEAKTTEEGAALWQEAQKQGRGNKFHAVPVTIDGVTYASTSEGKYSTTLKVLVAAGRLERYKPQPRFTLLERLPGAPLTSLKGTKKGQQKVLLANFAGRRFTFTLDYQVWPDPVSGAETAVLDTKSWATLTDDFFLRAAIFVRVYGIPMYAVMPNGEWIRA